MKVQVRKGDTLWGYSQLFHIPLALIMDSNPHVDEKQLKPGQAIHIPGFTVDRHTVQRGDTVWQLAASRGVNAGTLLLLNPHIDPHQLPVGQTLLIPSRVTRCIVSGKKRYDFQQMRKDMHQLLAIYPFMRQREAGRSVLGLPLYDIRIGRGERKVQINAAFHANEWITTPVLMKFLNEYLLSLTNYPVMRGVQTLPLYMNTQLSAVPMVDPDGVNLVLNGPPPEREKEVVAINKGSYDFSGWKANIRGVDLNKQFPANWEFESTRKPTLPSSRDFPGYAPLSEPETRAMADLVRKERFERLLALHTQGKEFYWGYEGLEPPDSEKLAQQFSRVSGYKAVRYVDSHSGYKDWFIQEFRKPGFTIELGEGQNPLPLSQFDEMYEAASKLLIHSLI
ncbi:M14 family metallopeptidase [Bacillus badius]|uniref:M14 family metallopeptidase n=1 Tax=Bacillus badius TaxID=1455 RepID=UPI0007B0749C|nr:M14 family metallopeptidase [Bacillus badius]KZO00063.1 peptidase M14 [Bacillus badius]MED0665520.1 M14 family metallopeptidase [Bacillus badius]OCS86224.1 peptidase M14 [Bacillus badius]OVE52314.1 peptidase M14 [Bacillus badius]TDW04040.1 g-D-glutamyl-meso-diaminopimelate peptidase [Bacillus badius]